MASDPRKPGEPSPSSLAACINTETRMKGTTWKAAEHSDWAVVEALAVHGVWWSGKRQRRQQRHRQRRHGEVNGFDVPVTVTTQATLDRLEQLLAQCRSWRGPLSAVIYIPLLSQEASVAELSDKTREQLLEATVEVDRFFSEVELEVGSCILQLMLVSELFTERKAMELYPINTLRNLARLQARTPLVGFIDVDMMLSSQLYDDLAGNETLRKRMLQRAKRRTVAVLPAFKLAPLHGPQAEARSHTLADLLVSQGKPFLVDSWSKGCVLPYHLAARFDSGHNWTLFDRWAKTKVPYYIRYGVGFEPWVLVDRFLAPWHDSRFRGYGYNKIAQIAHMHYLHFKFQVLPNAFLVHRNHGLSKIAIQNNMLPESFQAEAADPDCGAPEQDANLSLSPSIRSRSSLALKDAVTGASNFSGQQQRGQPEQGQQQQGFAMRKFVMDHNKRLLWKLMTQMHLRTYKPEIEAGVTNCLNSLSWWAKG